MSDVGDGLFGIVEAYWGLGVHRTGTAVDAATAEWMATQLRERGYEVVVEDVPFDRWVGEGSLVVDDEPVDHLPLYYQWVGDIDTDDLHVVGVDAEGGGHVGLLDDALRACADLDRSAVVFATEHAEGALVAVNRVIDPSPSGVPTVLIGGKDLARVRAGTAQLTMHGRVEPGVTHNVIGRAGGSGTPLMLTTPLNGWFRCAGERGTGVAVTLGLAEALAEQPMLVVATGGHELHYFGARHFVDTTAEKPSAIVHVGASIAVDETQGDGRRLIDRRIAMTSFDDVTAAPVIEALGPMRLLMIRTSTQTWLGEGEILHEMDVPLLSFTGSGVDFHTALDTPWRSTSPDALALVHDTLLAAIAAFSAAV